MFIQSKFRKYASVAVVALALYSTLHVYTFYLMQQETENSTNDMKHIDPVYSYSGFKDKLSSLTNSDDDVQGIPVTQRVKASKSDSAFYQCFQSFYTPIFDVMINQSDYLDRLQLSGRAGEKRMTKDELNFFIKLDDETIERYRSSHETVFQSLSPSVPENLYKGEGIVYIGGGGFTWMSILSIKSLRSFGCDLPVELVLPVPLDYEHDLCEEFLPSLNAKCVLLYDVFGEEMTQRVRFKGYQYKGLALIASSFEKVLLLDSDNIVVADPTPFFHEEPFKSYGMITWPDYWPRTVSPHFYQIANITINENLQVRQGKWPLKNPVKGANSSEIPYHDFEGALPDLATESGQVIINKKTHPLTLQLILFYNIFGPEYFYRLLSQGQAGEGDKETFPAAALKAQEPFYQVYSQIRTFGWFDHNGGFQGTSMGQRSPVEDYAQFNSLWEVEGDLETKARFRSFSDGKVPIFTIHANNPKLFPINLIRENKIYNTKGDEVRIYSDIFNDLKRLPIEEDMIGDDGKPVLGEKYDFELVQFQRMKYLLCELNLSLKAFNSMSRDEICRFIQGHLEFLHRHPVN